MRSLMRRYLMPYWRPIVLGVILVLMQAIAALSQPTLNAYIIDNGVTKGDTGYIVTVGGLMLLVAALQAGCAIASGYLAARVAMDSGVTYAERCSAGCRASPR